MSSDFATIFQEHLDARGMNRRAFAEQVACHTALVTMVAKGRRRVPPHAIDRWADALGLEGEEREAFIDAGLTIKAHERIVEHIAGMRAEITMLRKKLAGR